MPTQTDNIGNFERPHLRKLRCPLTSDIPRDPNGALDHIKQTGVLRAGIVSDARSPLEKPEQALLKQLARETGSQTEVTLGSAETLLPRVENGSLDIVVGRFAPDTP